MESYDITSQSEVSLNLEFRLPREQSKSFAPIDSVRLNSEKREGENLQSFRRSVIFQNSSNNFQTSASNAKISTNLKRGTIVRHPKLKTFKINQKRQSVASRSQTINPFLLSQNVKKVAKKMMSKMRNSLFYGSINNLSKYHYELINDKAASNCLDEETQKGTFMLHTTAVKCKIVQKFLGCIGLLINKYIQVFNPNHWLKILWDLLLILCIFITLFHYSMERAFGQSPDFSTNMDAFNINVTTLLYVDVLFSLNTLIYQNGIQITDRKKIFYKYKRTYLLPDIICCISSFTNMYHNLNGGWFDMDPVLFIKLFKYYEFEGRMKTVLIRNLKSESIYKIFMLIMKIFMMAHLLACFWHIIGYEEQIKNGDGPNWLKAKGIVEKPWKERYLYSIYWGVTTMLTVGYGDITPTNKNEVILNLWAMIIGCGLFAYSMNYIGDLLRNASRRESALKEQLGELRSILEKKELPKELQTKVTKYLEFIWEQEARDDSEQENIMMNRLSAKLRDEVLLHTNVKYLRQVKIFNMFGEKTLIRLANRMRKVRFSPEEFVYKSGEKEDASMFFIISGEMDRVSEREFGLTHNRVKWNTLKNEEYFGLHELLTGIPRISSILSLKFSSLFQLTRDDFIEVLKGSPEDYEKFCRVKDDILLNELKTLEISCISCNLRDHRVENCRLLRYSPSELNVIGKFLIKQKQWYKYYQRTSKKPEHALFNRNYILECQSDFLTMYRNDSEFVQLTQIYNVDGGPGQPDSNNTSVAPKYQNDESGQSYQLNVKNEENFMVNSAEEFEHDGKRESILSKIPVGRKNDFLLTDYQKGKERKKKLPSKEFDLNGDKSQVLQVPLNNLAAGGLNPNTIESNLQIDIDSRLKSFHYYYPHNNIEKIIKRMNKQRKLRLDDRRPTSTKEVK